MRRLAEAGANDADAHNFPCTMIFLTEAIGMLRAAGAEPAGDGGGGVVDLWRGLKALRVQDSFERTGGTEPACMSTTTDLNVALMYSLSRGSESLIFKVRTTSFMNRGANLEWCSAFPAEKEILCTRAWARTPPALQAPRARGLHWLSSPLASTRLCV
jgi:hypothetical protein